MPEPGNQPPQGGAPAGGVFELGQAPPSNEAPPARQDTPQTPDDMVRIFKGALDKIREVSEALIQVGKQSPTLAPHIQDYLKSTAKFIDEVAKAGGKEAQAQPGPAQQQPPAQQPPVRPTQL